MPEFTVIAGPNGAGKSSFSARLSQPGAIIFDPDRQKAAIEKIYPDISPEAIESAVTQKYLVQEVKAMISHADLTVESNLRDDFIVERSRYFKEHGYKTNLYFMLLPNIEASMDRVNLRVRHKGHYVDPESIRYNFSHSLGNLKNAAAQFDNFMLICASSAYGILSMPIRLLETEHGRLIHESRHIPRWAKPITAELKELLTVQRHLTVQR